MDRDLRKSNAHEEVLWRQVFSSTRHAKENTEGERGKQLFICSCFGVLTCGVMARSVFSEKDGNTIFLAALICLIIGSLAGVALVFISNRRIKDTHAAGVLLFYMATIVLCDLQSSMLLEEKYWPLFVPIIDFFVLLGATERITNLFACIALIWVIISDVEAFARFGLYDDYAISYSNRQGAMCGCSTPPCVVDKGVVLTSLYFKILGLVFNFILVRHLVKSTQSERDKIQNAVTIAQSTAYYLSRYELDKAETTLLDGADNVPEGLSMAFFEMIQTLRLYKPYLPLSCLPGVHNETNDAEEDSTPHSQDETISTCSTNYQDTLASDSTGAQAQERRASALKRLSKDKEENPSVTFSSLEQNTNKCDEETSETDFGKIQPATQSEAAKQSGLLLRPLRAHTPASKRERRSKPDSEEPCPVKRNSGGNSRRESLFGTHTSSPLPTAPPSVSKRSKLTLVVFNMHSSMRMIDECSGRFEANLAQILAAVVSRVTEKKGVVDMFQGDHIYGAFNASRSCPRHALSALGTAQDVLKEAGSIDLNIAICTGKAYHCDLGCTEMRRYSVFGRLPVVLASLERKGREWCYPVVINQGTYTDCQTDYECRLLPKTVYLKWKPRPSVSAKIMHLSMPMPSTTRRQKSTEGPDEESTGTPFFLYEVLNSSGMASTHQKKDNQNEWMYTIQTSRWEGYNAALGRILKGDDSEEMRAKVAALPEEIQDALEKYFDVQFTPEYLDI